VALFSSLRADKFKSVAGGGGGSVPKLYMPVWSLDESVRCVIALHQLGMTNETVGKRFEVVKGSVSTTATTSGRSRSTVLFMVARLAPFGPRTGFL
jgi:hypothetical protein